MKDNEAAEKAWKIIDSIMKKESINEVTLERKYLPEVFNSKVLELSKEDGLPTLKLFIFVYLGLKGIITNLYGDVLKFTKTKVNPTLLSYLYPKIKLYLETRSDDAKGTLLSPKSKPKFKRLAKIHRSLTTKYERNLWIALPNLQRLQKRLGIPDAVAEDALRIYTQIVKKKLTMGRSIDTLLSASIFTSLRVHGIPRTAEEISRVAQIPIKKVIESYRLILMEVLPKLGMKVQY